MIRHTAHIAFIAAALTLTPAAFAGEAEDRIIKSVSESYGLATLKTFSMTTEARATWVGQGYTASFTELNPERRITHFDLAGERGSDEYWGGPGNPSVSGTMSSPEGIANISYTRGSYNIDAEGSYYASFGGIIRTSDTLLAYELAKQIDTVKHTGLLTYQGTPHDTVTLEMPSSPPLTLYVNSDTGMISKMTRETGFGRLEYQFGDFKTQDGIAYAEDFNLWVDDLMVIYAKSRTVEVNDIPRRAFKVNRELALEGEVMDRSEMTVDGIGETVHHVGTGNGYTTFIDAGDHIIAVGGYVGLKDRWAAFQAEHGQSTKPLRYQIVTHHHEDHLGGMKEAHDIGVTFVVPAMAVDDVKARIGTDLPDERMQVIDGTTTLGPVEIYDITTDHVGSFALAYIPSERAIFQVDHYGGEFIDGVGEIRRSTVSLVDAIDTLGLDVDIVLNGHGRKPEKWSELKAAIAENYVPGPCPTGRAICR